MITSTSLSTTVVDTREDPKKVRNSAYDRVLEEFEGWNLRWRRREVNATKERFNTVEVPLKELLAIILKSEVRLDRIGELRRQMIAQDSTRRGKR